MAGVSQQPAGSVLGLTPRAAHLGKLYSNRRGNRSSSILVNSVDSIVAVDSSEAETPSTSRPTRQSASSPTSGDELENIIGTQVDEVQYVDSQSTTVEGDDDSQQQPSPGSSSGSESAEDKTRFRSH